MSKNLSWIWWVDRKICAEDDRLVSGGMLSEAKDDPEGPVFLSTPQLVLEY